MMYIVLILSRENWCWSILGLTPRSAKVWPPLINLHSFMQTLTHQKSRTVSSWLLIGLSLYERMWVNQKQAHTFGLIAVKGKSYSLHSFLFASQSFWGFSVLQLQLYLVTPVILPLVENYLITFCCNCIIVHWHYHTQMRQGGRVVSASDSQSGSPGFESCSGHFLGLFSAVLSWNPWPCL